MKTPQDIFDLIHWNFSGEDHYYRVTLDGRTVYQTKDARDRDLFITQLKLSVLREGNT